MHNPPLQTSDYIGPVVGAFVFMAIMSLVKEPTRRTVNALIVTGAAGVYMSGGFGPWELVYPAAVSVIAYFGFRSYRYIGIGWLLHAGWDLAHHLYGNPLWPFMPTSSFGCLLLDSTIAVWFLAGAPSLFALASRKPAAARASL